MKILIIEDEVSLSDAIKTRLEKENMKVDSSIDGKDGFYIASSSFYDLIILDVMLPGMNGFEILKKLRENKIDSKIIMLTAKSTIEDKLEGLTHGADDYVTKPFHMDELIARINIQLKINNKNNIIKFNDLILDKYKSKLTCTTSLESVELICKELQLLEYFIDNSKIILSKEQIYNKIWGLENEIESNNLEAYLSFIRKKLKAINSTVNIKSVRGLGYKLESKNE